jgi:hypothetical protein
VEDLHPKKLIAQQLSSLDEVATESKIEFKEIKQNAQIDPDLL